MPNPTTGSDEEVRIVFDTANAEETRISVYAVTGELVWQTAPASRAARQEHSVAWDGRNAAGKRVARYVLSRFGSRWPDRDPYARSFTRLKTPLKKKRALAAARCRAHSGRFCACSSFSGCSS